MATTPLFHLGSKYGHDSLVPFGVEDHCGLALTETAVVHHGLYGCFRNLLVHAFALLIVKVYDLAYTLGLLVIAGHQQMHGGAARFHPAGGIDARTYFKDYVIYRYLVILQSRQPDDGLKPLARGLVKALKTVICQDAVLSSHGYQICGDADGHQVEEGFHPCERNGLAHGVCLYQLESHPATGQIIERVAAVGTFGVENGHCGRKLLVRKVVVADDHVHAEGFGIGYLLHGLYAAVQSYDKRVSVLVSS